MLLSIDASVFDISFLSPAAISLIFYAMLRYRWCWCLILFSPLADVFRLRHYYAISFSLPFLRYSFLHDISFLRCFCHYFLLCLLHGSACLLPFMFRLLLLPLFTFSFPDIASRAPPLLMLPPADAATPPVRCRHRQPPDAAMAAAMPFAAAADADILPWYAYFCRAMRFMPAASDAADAAGARHSGESCFFRARRCRFWYFCRRAFSRQRRWSWFFDAYVSAQRWFAFFAAHADFHVSLAFSIFLFHIRWLFSIFIILSLHFRHFLTLRVSLRQRLSLLRHYSAEFRWIRRRHFLFSFQS